MRIRGAPFLALALAASCASAPRVRTVAAPACPPGWTFLYTERAHERGGRLVERAVCREAVNSRRHSRGER